MTCSINIGRLTDLAEIQLLKRVALERRDTIKELQSEISDLRARRNFVEELIAEIGFLAIDDNIPSELRFEMIQELIDWIIDVLDNGFDSGQLDEDFNMVKEAKGFEEEDIFKYRS